MFLPAVLLAFQLLSWTANGQNGGGTVIFQNNGSGIPAGAMYCQDVGGANTAYFYNSYIPPGTSSWTVAPVSGDPPDNPGWYATHPFSGDQITMPFSCGGNARFTLNGGSYTVVLNSNGCYDADATLFANPPSPVAPTQLDPTRDAGPDPNKDDCGMPAWDVTEPFISLWLSDEPLGYQPSIGPRVSFALKYNQRDTDGYITNFSQNFFSAGKNWGCSWRAYVYVDASGATRVKYPDGGEAYYNDWVDSPAPMDYRNNTRFSGNQTNGFTVSYPDGRKDVYGFVVTNAGGGFIAAFLSQRFNVQGQSLALNYSPYTPANYPAQMVVHLQSVVDGDGRTNLLYYNNPSNPNLISSVVDAFGRTAFLLYNGSGDLTNITDGAGNSSSLNYGTNDWVASLTTPYGTTSFAITGGTNSAVPNGRSILVTRPDASRELYLYTDSTPGQPNAYATYAIPNSFLDGYTNQAPLIAYNSFHWGPRQFAALSTTNITSFTANDFRKAWMKHWKIDSASLLVNSLAMEREPSPDGAGAAEGQKTWYFYSGGTFLRIGTQSLPEYVSRLLPDGNTANVIWGRNSWGNPSDSMNTYPVGHGKDYANIFNNQRTTFFNYAANGIDVITVINALGAQVSSNSYNAFHQTTAHYDALNELTAYTYNTNQQVASITLPSGLVTTNLYNPDHSLAEQIIVGFATNSYTYANDLVLTRTDARGLTTTNTWDNLDRLTSTRFPDGSTISNIYTKLDLTATKDRLGNWTYLGYDSLRRNTAITNELGRVTINNYCTCGALESVLDAASQLTQFFYDNQGNLTNTVYADGYAAFKTCNLLGQVVTAGDSAGQRLTNTYNDQGLLAALSNAAGQVRSQAFDALNRVTNSVDANGVSINTAYDNLNRPLTRSYPDGGVEKFGYTPNVAGPTSYTNQIGNVTLLAYDALGRKTNEVAVGVTTNGFAYNGAGDLLAVTDGRSQTTHWNFDAFGRVTNKVDAAGVVDFVYQYDANNRLTNRWTPAKGNTAYAYDAVGNRTNINYGGTSSIFYAYDALNRMTNAANSLGAIHIGYNAAGEVLSAGGLWSGDTVTYAYTNRLRGGLTVGAWNQTYGHDAALRLTNLTSGAGSFGCVLGGAGAASSLIKQLNLPNGAMITNSYDAVARLASTKLLNSQLSTLNSFSYGYNQLGQRTNIVRNQGSAGSGATASYDAIGELTGWRGKETNGTTRLNEQLGYAYDAAGNLKQRTNNALVQTFSMDAANALTNVARSGTLTVSGNTLSPASSVTVNGQAAQTYGDLTFASGNGFTLADGQNSFTTLAQNAAGRTVTNTLAVNLPASAALLYDANGNLTNSGGASSASPTIYAYDAENQLTNVMVAGQWREDFLYDALSRRRVTRQYAWSSGSWILASETHYIYDGNAVIQEWDTNNNVLVTYTRGMDLSGGFQGAGGIGGLLARTDARGTAFYHADGNGNITALVNGSQNVVARYLYDPFGRPLGQWGPLADANKYRFSSKEWDALSGMYYYGFRFYDPNLQRWLNRDPLGEPGFEVMQRGSPFRTHSIVRKPAELVDGPNLYEYVTGDPINHFDTVGLAIGREWTGLGGATWTINGITYPGTTKTDFIAAIRQATWNGDTVHSIIYNGHSDPINGALLMYGSQQDANDPNTSFFPDDLRSYLTYFSDYFDPFVTVELRSCGTANPLNPNNPAQAFLDIFPFADVYGWTGLTFAGKWGLGSNNLIDRDYWNSPFVPRTSTYVKVN